MAALYDRVALIGLGLATLGAALLWLPGTSTYFARWDELRSLKAGSYRRPDSIYYGRLPRFR